MRGVDRVIEVIQLNIHVYIYNVCVVVCAWLCVLVYVCAFVCLYVSHLALASIASVRLYPPTDTLQARIKQKKHTVHERTCIKIHTRKS
jgi:hypothetical protein